MEQLSQIKHANILKFQNTAKKGEKQCLFGLSAMLRRAQRFAERDTAVEHCSRLLKKSVLPPPNCDVREKCGKLKPREDEFLEARAKGS